MSGTDDKAKKLKEIQERLAAIQHKKSPADEPKSARSSNESIKPPKPEAAEPTSPKKEKSETGNSLKKETPTVTPKPEMQPAPASKEVPQPAESKSAEAKPWSDNKPLNEKDEKIPKKAVRKQTEPISDKSGKLKIVPIISFIVTLIVVGYFGYSYFLSDTPPETASENKVNSELIEAGSTDDTPDVTPDSENEAQVEKGAEARSEPETPVAEENASPTPKPEPKAAVVGGSQKIPTGFIISYASNSTKEAALNNVSMLQNNGFKAGFYWMPDQKKGNPSLFKVYAGPYDNESAAFPDFKKIIKLNDKAFILRMDS